MSMNIRQIISIVFLVTFISYLGYKLLDTLPNIADQGLIIAFVVVVVLILIMLIIRLLTH